MEKTNPNSNNKFRDNQVTIDTQFFLNLLMDFGYTKKKLDNNPSNNPHYITFENSTSEDTSTPSSSTSGNSNNTPTSTTSTQVLPNYTNDIQYIVQTFNDVKEILKRTKFLQCIKKNSIQTKNLNNPLQKTLVIIKEFYNLTKELDNTNDK